MWTRRTVMLAGGCLVLLSAVTVYDARSQSAVLFSWDNAGSPVLVPGVTLPQSPSWAECSDIGGGGVDCAAVPPPIKTLEDANGDELGNAPSVLQMEAELYIAEGDPNHARQGIQPDYRPQYDTVELDQMGAVTVDKDAPLGATYTEGADFELREVGGSLRSLGRTYSFDCKAVSLNGTKYYCAYAGDADATATQADAETRAAQACAAVEAVAVTVLTNATPPVASTIPASCTLNVGSSLNGTDSGTLGTVAATTAGNTFTPSSAITWAKGDRRAIWVQSTGAGCSGSRTLRLEVGCF